MTNENEVEWWDDEAYWHDASPFNLGNENMHWDVEKIVAEAMRLGEVKAWEEICKILDFVPDFQSITRKAHKKLTSLKTL